MDRPKTVHGWDRGEGGARTYVNAYGYGWGGADPGPVPVHRTDVRTAMDRLEIAIGPSEDRSWTEARPSTGFRRTS